MGLFGRSRKKDDAAGTAVRLDGRELLYAVRRYTDENGNPVEDGLGRGGRIDTAAGHVIITCGDREVFVNKDSCTVECGELMNLSGAIFTGYNEVTGREDTIIAYYQARFRA